MENSIKKQNGVTSVLEMDKKTLSQFVDNYCVIDTKIAHKQMQLDTDKTLIGNEKDVFINSIHTHYNQFVKEKAHFDSDPYQVKLDKIIADENELKYKDDLYENSKKSIYKNGLKIFIGTFISIIGGYLLHYPILMIIAGFDNYKVGNFTPKMQANSIAIGVITVFLILILSMNVMTLLIRRKRSQRIEAHDKVVKDIKSEFRKVRDAYKEQEHLSKASLADTFYLEERITKVNDAFNKLMVDYITPLESEVKELESVKDSYLACLPEALTNKNDIYYIASNLKQENISSWGEAVDKLNKELQRRESVQRAKIQVLESLALNTNKNSSNASLIKDEIEKLKVVMADYDVKSEARFKEKTSA
ncbi:MAG: hypothetical protein GX038_03645 [Erysipelothrix sp.]|nr:hypothetical protein [Erysipelothrix sp.]